MSKETMWTLLKKKGFSDLAAATIMGHMVAESGCCAYRLQGDFSVGYAKSVSYTQQVDSGAISRYEFIHKGPNGGGYGACQWTFPSRKEGLYDTAKKMGESIGSDNVAVEWLWQELHQGEYASVLKALMTGNSIRTMSDVFLAKYEKPANQSAATQTHRASLAEEIYREFAGTINMVQASSITLDEAINKILGIAATEIGYREKANNSQLNDKVANAGSGNYTKYACDLDAVANFYNGKKNGYAYCDVFHDWLHYKAWGASMAMKVLCQPERSLGAGCVYSAQYYKQAGRWSSEPHRGDQIFFYSGGNINHTGIVENVSNGVVTTIEGNTSDMVARKTYPINSSYIAGYGRPRYELVTDGTQTALPCAAGDSETHPMLRKGSSGPAVYELQSKLSYAGYPVGNVDGEFGNKTYVAVKIFQEQCGLEIDGIVGPNTWAVLDKVYNDLRATRGK